MEGSLNQILEKRIDPLGPIFWVSYSDQTASWSPQKLGDPPKKPETFKFRNYSNLPRFCLEQIQTSCEAFVQERWGMIEMIELKLLVLTRIKGPQRLGNKNIM